jgi:heat-inducible transcriptional repressor
VVREYVALAQPVASDLIARKYESDLSPATVRNEMAALEEAGLIAQPHTSAGRVPTDHGYRYFVELLQKEERDLTRGERRTLRQQFHALAASGADSTHLGAGVLARALRSAAVATRPAASHARVRRIELVPLEPDQVLVTLIMQSGGVRQLVHRTEVTVARDELTRLSNELSEKLADKTAGQVRRSLRGLSDAARPFASAAVRLLQQAQEQALAVSLEGLAQLLAQPEFAQAQKLRPILEVLEQQPMLARFLAESLGNPGVQVIIGAENRLEQMREASLVLTRYGSDDADAWGVLGVLGPTRLPYWRAVPMVRFIAELMDVVENRPGL